MAAGIVINVLDPQYGVSADGVTDDTLALKVIRDSLAALGGGTMYFPPKNYHVSGYLELFDNFTVLGPGATLLKLPTSSRQASFVAKSNGVAGFGSGARNVTIEGITFKGTFAGNKGNGAALHHVEDVHFRNVTFEECVIRGHAVDLGGCRRVRFTNCTFAGWKVSGGREFTEAIQCDYSTAATVGLDTDAASFDGLPTVDVVVEACHFMSLTIDGTTYPAPNPIGCHTRVEGQQLEDIHFINNIVRDGYRAVGGIGSIATFHKGWIHLGYGKGFKIRGNKFVSMHSAPTCVINITSPQSAYPMSSVGDPKASMYTVPPIPVEQFEFIDNEFIGFKSDEPIDRQEPLIYISEFSDPARAKEFRFQGTTFTDCSYAVAEKYNFED